MIVIRGKTECNFCSRVINKEDDVIMIPMIFENKKDDLFFEEIVMHKTCFKKYPNNEVILQIYNELIHNNKICSICNKKIINPDNYYKHNILTSDKSNLLFKYNNTEYHKDCYFNSQTREIVLKKIEEMKKENQWESVSSKKF